MSLEINVTEMKLYIQEYNLYCSLHLVREDTASSYSKKKCKHQHTYVSWLSNVYNYIYSNISNSKSCILIVQETGLTSITIFTFRKHITFDLRKIGSFPLGNFLLGRGITP